MAFRTRLARSRTLVLSVLALLSVLQMALVQTARERGAPSPSSQIGEIVAVEHGPGICRSDDGGAPAEKCPHDGRCIVCAPGARVAVTPIAAICVAILVMAPTPAEPPGWSLVSTVAPPQGWASSWSSRAPPFFS